MPAQYLEVAQTLRSRIEHGDYRLNRFPATRRLASELGVSHMVARKAIEKLVDDGVIAKGTAKVPAAPPSAAVRRQPAVAMLAPAYNSPFFTYVRLSLEKAARTLGVMIRPVDYLHWDDPIVFDTLQGFDGVFLLSLNTAMPEPLERRIQASRKPVVAIERDLTGLGVPSIQVFSSQVVETLLDHLCELGHRRIACLNVQMPGAIAEDRIGTWRSFTEARNLSGQLIDEPPDVDSFIRPVQQAYQVFQGAIAKGIDGSAVFCTTEEAAMGAMRAAREVGMRIGEDLSICAVSDIGYARFQNPTLTAVEFPDIVESLSESLRWMQARRRRWEGPMLVSPAQVSLFEGESTGTPPPTEMPQSPGPAPASPDPDSTGASR